LVAVPGAEEDGMQTYIAKIYILYDVKIYGFRVPSFVGRAKAGGTIPQILHTFHLAYKHKGFGNDSVHTVAMRSLSHTNVTTQLKVDHLQWTTKCIACVAYHIAWIMTMAV